MRYLKPLSARLFSLSAKVGPQAGQARYLGHHQKGMKYEGQWLDLRPFRGGGVQVTKGGAAASSTEERYHSRTEADRPRPTRPREGEVPATRIRGQTDDPPMEQSQPRRLRLREAEQPDQPQQQQQ